MTDPISDLLTRIRNAQMVEKLSVRLPASRIKNAVTKVLLDEGYIGGFEVVKNQAGFPELVIDLKYYAGRPVIEKIDRVSRQSHRRYAGWQELPRPSNGLGISIVSTSKGIMSDRHARAQKIGGEVICTVY
jgi:small subunit ribosomal protein S8